MEDEAKEPHISTHTVIDLSKGTFNEEVGMRFQVKVAKHTVEIGTRRKLTNAVKRSQFILDG